MNFFLPKNSRRVSLAQVGNHNDFLSENAADCFMVGTTVVPATALQVKSKLNQI